MEAVQAAGVKKVPTALQVRVVTAENITNLTARKIISFLLGKEKERVYWIIY